KVGTRTIERELDGFFSETCSSGRTKRWGRRARFSFEILWGGLWTFALWKEFKIPVRDNRVRVRFPASPPLLARAWEGGGDRRAPRALLGALLFDRRPGGGPGRIRGALPQLGEDLGRLDQRAADHAGRRAAIPAAGGRARLRAEGLLETLELDRFGSGG